MAALVISCDQVSAAVNGIVEVCHEIQENLNFNGRIEVFNLLSIITAKKPYYSAAGFFIINKRTLLTFFSVITTYFIVVIQFNQ